MVKKKDKQLYKKFQDRGDCMWFAGCTNPATGTTPHPILGDVPTCVRCHKFATGQEAHSKKHKTQKKSLQH